MSKETTAVLQEQLDLKQKELDLVMAIDRIRDTIPKPEAMLSAIVNLLADRLDAEACWLALADRESGKLELKVVNDRTGNLGQFGELFSSQVAGRAAQLTRLTIWQGQELFPAGAGAGIPPALQLAAMPVILGRENRLGVLLLARSHTPFTPTDMQLLAVAEDQLDSAVIQGYTYHDLQQRVKELEIIYRIDRIRDQGLPFDDMLNLVIEELRAIIGAEVSFVMLYNRSGKQLEMRAATDDDLFQMSGVYRQVGQIASAALQQAKLVYRHNIGPGLRSIMCLPLILNDQIIGVLGVMNRRAGLEFDAEDRRLLAAIGSQMDTAIFESLEQRRLRQVLGRSVDPQVMERLLSNADVDFLKGERSVLTVLYADIRGSTRLAEQTEPEQLVGFINHYLGRMTEVILAYEGTLDKFVGDEVMALFGAPFPHPDHALRAVRTGLAMQEAHREVMAAWQQQGVNAAPIGIGIATGEMIVGEMGSSQRTDYTVIGRAANLGARICSAAKAGQVLISQATYNMVKDSVEASPIPNMQFKGVESDVTVYHVHRVR